MNWLLDLPFPAQLAILFAAGLFIGGQLNRAIYRLSIEPKHYDPWTEPLEDAPPRQWWDHIPVIGWIGLSRESKLHGDYFWVRPMLLELFTGLVFAGLYAWELDQRLIPEQARIPPGHIPMQVALRMNEVISLFLAHAILFCFLLVASMIDFDEKLIPDQITTPGTILGLLLAAFLPLSLLPDSPPGLTDGLQIRPLLLSDPLPLWDTAQEKDPLNPQGSDKVSWPPILDGWEGLALGLAAYALWWGAVVDLVWRTRRGFGWFLWLLGASIIRARGLAWRMGLLVFGLAGVTGVWYLGHPHWPGLMSSLAGMMLGGGVILMFRIVGGYFLSQEAMGYGDVTLMAMIGAFLGWQPTLIAIFLAPLAAVGFSIGQAVLTGKQDIYFGPFLSLAAMGVIVLWGMLWLPYGRPWFLGVIQFWQYTLALVVAFPIVMGVLLIVTRAIRQRVWPDEDDEETAAA